MDMNGRDGKGSEGIVMEGIEIGGCWGSCGR